MERQQLHRLSERVWYMDPTVATDRPQLGYVRGDRFSVMIDAGNSPAHAALFFDLLREQDLPLPKYCLITHWHWDHTFGIAGLPIPALCGSRTAERLRSLTAEDLRAMWTGEDVRTEYPDPDSIRVRVPELVFDGELTLDAGGVTLRLLPVGGPHSDDSVIVWVPEEKLVFGGDSSSGNFDLPNIAYDLPLLEEHEKLLRAIPFQTYLHAHRPVMDREAFFAFLDAGRKRGYYTFD